MDLCRGRSDRGEFRYWLQTQNIGSGDRVAIALRNYPEWIFAYWGVIAVGGAVVGMNAWWVADEMAYALNDSEPKLLIADDQRLAIFAQIAGDFPDLSVVAVRDAAPAVPAAQWSDTITGAAELPMPPIDPNDDACIFYTSGTTGRPKGAQLTHRGCVHNIMNVAAMGQIFGTTQAMNRGETVEAPVSAPPATSLVATPLFHVTANNCVMHGATISGGKLILMYKWDTSEALKLIEREQVNTLSAVPMMTRELLGAPRFCRVRHIEPQLIGWRGCGDASRLAGQGRREHKAGEAGAGLRDDRGVWHQYLHYR